MPGWKRTPAQRLAAAGGVRAGVGARDQQAAVVPQQVHAPVGQHPARFLVAGDGGVLVHTAAPGSRDARSLYTAPGYAAALFRHSCGLTSKARLKAVERAKALP